MKVFLAGSTGAIGKTLLPHLVASGHQVVALVRTAARAAQVEALGGVATVADPFDKIQLTAAIERAEPEIVMHELTALAGTGNFRRFDEEFALTNRFRTEVLDTMLAAARRVRARRFIAQSFCGWPFAREGGPVKTEADPLDPNPPATFRKSLAAIRYLENAIRAAEDVQAVALRYGILYGPGTGIAKGGPIAKLVRRRHLPIVGDGAGVWSFIHIKDVAHATEAAMSRGAPGIYNVVDDEPAPVSTWLPCLAEALGARPPRRLSVWLAGFLFGEGGVSMMTRVRGGSNAKAKRELGWQPMYSSWRDGFSTGL
jgi:nucleoside-diphosphate-sugar epimerase